MTHLLRVIHVLFLLLSAIHLHGQQGFTDVTEEAGIDHVFLVYQGTFGGRVAVLDYDNDGDLDLFIVNQHPINNPSFIGTHSSRLFRNDASDDNWIKVNLNGEDATSR